jgi:uncharacterized protein (UPF0335 family)
MSEATRIKEEIKDIEELIKIFNEYPNGNGFNDKTRNRIIKKLEQKKKSLEFTYKMINPCPKKPIEKFCNPINYTK